MENISSRLKKYIDYKNLSIRAFERSLDWGNSTVNNTKDSIASEKMMQLKETYPELNLQWVLMGVGDMIVENYLDDPFSPRYTQLPEKNEPKQLINPTVKETLAQLEAQKKIKLNIQTA